MGSSDKVSHDGGWLRCGSSAGSEHAGWRLEAERGCGMPFADGGGDVGCASVVERCNGVLCSP